MELERIVQQLKEFKPKRLILFGSRQQGTSRAGSDLDIAFIQKGKVQLGQKAKVYLALSRSGYDWQPEIDLHLLSEDVYKEKLKEGDLFVREIEKGRVLYSEKPEFSE